MPDLLLNVLARQQSVLVFPSEVVARFWRRSALQQSGRRALSAERVISWDAFKERVFEIRAAARPVNATLRRIFVTQLLRENQNEPFLRAIVNPAYRDNSAAFVGLVQRSLPALQVLADRGALRRADEPLLHDLATLHQRYSAFLGANGLFEPGWYRAGISAPRANHTVVFAELIEDYTDFAADLASAATVSTIPLSAVAAAEGAGAAPAVYEYSNAHQEVAAVLSQVEELLDQGVEADEIAISVAELEQYQPFLQRYADLHAIPLLFRSGRPLSDSAAGRFIRGLSTAVSSGFAFDALRGLLLDHAVPWRKPHYGRQLVRAAIEAGCLKQRLGSRSLSAAEGSAGGPAAGEEWLRAIAVSSAERAELKQYYRGLRDSLSGIASARGAAELRQRLLAFVRRFLDSEGWDPDNLKRFQRALDELKQLAAAEVSLGVKVEDGYALWLGLLDQTLYVARSEHGGVAVFPYRVAAGARPRYHFVINASHDGTRVLENPFSFVREDLRERLGLSEKDFSDAFLRAYALSGETVQFSYSVQSFAGPRFAAGYLAGSVEPASAESDDLYRLERQRWESGLEHVPPRLYPDQARGLASIVRTGLQRRGTDFTRQAVSAGTLRERLLQRSKAQTPVAGASATEDGGEALLALSANRIDSYRGCPFGHLLQHPLGIEELDFSVAVQPALAVGTHQHAVLEALYRRIAQDDPLLRPELIERYEQILDEVLRDQRLLRSATRRLPWPVASLVSRITRDGVRRLLRAELELIGPQRVEHTELQLSRVFSRAGVQLSGRIDRVSRYAEDNSCILVDYKRRGSAGRTQVVGRDGDPATITTVQLPLYMLLLEQDGRRVERAYYFQVETGKIVTVLAPDPRRYSLSEDQRRRLLDYVVQLIDDVAAGLRGGDYRFPEPVTGCSQCRFRGICRARFAVQQE